MRKVYLVMVWAAWLAVGCAGSAKEGRPEMSDREKARLNGPVKSVAEMLAPAAESFDGKIETYEQVMSFEDVTVFNEAGCQVMYKHTYNGERTGYGDMPLGLVMMMIDKEVKRTYNEHNKLVGEVEVRGRLSGPDKDTSRYVLSYYDDGLTLRSSVKTETGAFSKTTTEFVCNEFGDGVSETSYRVSRFDTARRKEHETLFRNEYENGRMVGRETVTTHYEYDYTKQEAVCADKERISEWYAYDRSGNRVETRTKRDALPCDGQAYGPADTAGCSRELRRFDRDGNCLEVRTYMGNRLAEERVAAYDDAGRETSYTIRDGEGRLESERLTTYDADGRVLTVSERTGDGQPVLSKWVYDGDGGLVRTEAPEITEEVRERDAHGNWTLCYRYDPYGKLMAVLKRQIRYFE